MILNTHVDTIHEMRRLFSVVNTFTRQVASSSTKPQSPLASLRKRTGFSISKCKEALVKHENDLLAAEKWLHETARKEGWARAEQLSGRATQQGLIGALVRGNRAAMVEVSGGEANNEYRISLKYSSE